MLEREGLSMPMLYVVGGVAVVVIALVLTARSKPGKGAIEKLHDKLSDWKAKK